MMKVYVIVQHLNISILYSFYKHLKNYVNYLKEKQVLVWSRQAQEQVMSQISNL